MDAANWCDSPLQSRRTAEHFHDVMDEIQDAVFAQLNDIDRSTLLEFLERVARH